MILGNGPHSLATERLNGLGQSLWLDNITRELLDSGRFAEYIRDLSVTGLTSNPTIFDHAITHSDSYDRDIARFLNSGVTGEALFFRLAIDDLSRAADLLLAVHQRTATIDGWVSLEVSPLLAYDAQTTILSAKALYAEANRPNLFVKIPGTRDGLAAIEEAIFSGVPVNVTLLFSPEQYVAAVDAYMRGLERRVLAGLSPDVRSVASLFISRWDRAVATMVPDRLNDRLGIAIGKVAFGAYRRQLDSDRWQRLENLGARAQRLLFASTSTKDPEAPDVLYVDGLAAPHTVNTMPESTLRATADHAAADSVLRPDGGDGATLLVEFAKAGIDIAALAEKLQNDGAEEFVKSWRDLLHTIELKGKALS